MTQPLSLMIRLSLATSLMLTLAGCKSGTATIQPDPAAANLAPVTQTATAQPYASQPAPAPTRVLGQQQAYAPQQQGENYDQYAENQQAPQGAYDEADQPPPPLPNYQQPPAPGSGYIWTPGYWGHGPSGYAWVQGTWARPPYQRALWTPGYWHANGRRYNFHRGYWGPHVGYYGGIDYGAGYVGTGYYGGYWNNDQFYYNRVYNNLPQGFTTVYERPAVYNNHTYGGAGIVSSISFNGLGGIVVGPQPYELAAMRERHLPPMVDQFHENRVIVNGGYGEHVIVNHGHPDGFVPPGQSDRGWGGKEGHDRGDGRQGEGHDHGHGRD